VRAWCALFFQRDEAQADLRALAGRCTPMTESVFFLRRPMSLQALFAPRRAEELGHIDVLGAGSGGDCRGKIASWDCRWRPMKSSILSGFTQLGRIRRDVEVVYVRAGQQRDTPHKIFKCKLDDRWGEAAAIAVPDDSHTNEVSGENVLSHIRIMPR